MSQNEHVIILGASTDRRKFGNKAVRANLSQGHHVYPINPHATEIEGVSVYPDLASLPDEIHFDRLLVYLPPEIGLTQLEAISQLNLNELWFNPGSESPELTAQAEALGLSPILACSILAIGHSPTEFTD